MADKHTIASLEVEQPEYQETMLVIAALEVEHPEFAELPYSSKGAYMLLVS